MLELFAALTLQAATAVEAPPVTAPSPIVVTGVKLSDLRIALDKCVKGGCTTRDDVIASVRYAEGLLRTGNYLDARRVLAKSVGRNKKGVEGDPVAVAQLYEAQSTVEEHYGDQQAYHQAISANARILKQYRPDSVSSLLAEMRMIDLRVREGDVTSAPGSYAALAEKARGLGKPSVASTVEIRQAWALHLLKMDGPAQKLLGEVAARPDGGIGTASIAELMLVRIDRLKGDDAKADSRIEAMVRANAASTQPVLLYEPPTPKPVDMREEAAKNPFDSSGPGIRPSEARGLQWVDIGFSINPDGTVDAPEVLRGSRDNRWAKPVVAMIAARRYAPLADEADAQARYRIERFTLTADYGTPIGSLVRRRIFNQRIERLDLTPTAPSAG